MAVPTNLWFTSFEGSFRDGPPGDPKVNDVRKRWSLTFYLQADVAGYDATVENAMLIWTAQVYPAFPPRAFISNYVHRDKITVVHVATASKLENTFSIVIGSSADKPVPPQAAVFGLGRARQIKRQCRHWLPGLSIAAATADGRPNIGDGSTDVATWIRGLFVPTTITAIQITPVVYDESTETARAIESIAVSKEWRTIRRRCLGDPDDIIEVAPP